MWYDFSAMRMADEIENLDCQWMYEWPKLESEGSSILQIK